MKILSTEIIKKIRSKFLSPILGKLYHLELKQTEILHRLEYVQRALGRVELRQLNAENSLDLHNHEYQVFSQWGEDGIIQFLLKHIFIKEKIFVEFGVEDYSESNTRFLLINNNWAGLVMDGGLENITKIKSSYIYWHYNLKAVQAFVTKENINDILKENGIIGEIGLLSIDIDGNDYWVWDAINVVDPVIVIIEYNHRFGSQETVAIPYNSEFQRAKAHHSMIYFGASLKALCDLANRKGYAFIGCNRNGVNAFFVRRDKKPDYLKEVSPEEGYMPGQFCEFRNSNGIKTKMTPQEERNVLENLDLPILSLED